MGGENEAREGTEWGESGARAWVNNWNENDITPELGPTNRRSQTMERIMLAKPSVDWRSLLTAQQGSLGRALDF